MTNVNTRILAMVGLLVLGAITVMAFLTVGLSGFWAGITHSWATLQIFVDLVIAMLFVVVWMWRDAKASGRNPWPWIIAAFIVGSFSPLVYLLVRKPEDKMIA